MKYKYVLAILSLLLSVTIISQEEKEIIENTKSFTNKGKEISIVTKTKRIEYRFQTTRLLSVVVFIGKEKIQTIADSSTQKYDYIGNEICRFEDVNFDGYTDILVKNSDHKTYRCWVFAPKTNKYSEVAKFSELIEPYIDNNKKQIVSTEMKLFAHCQSECTTSYYVIKKAELTMVNQTFFRSDSNPNDKPKITPIKETPVEYK